MKPAVYKNKYGNFELLEKPTAETLQAYYAEKYYQSAQGSYEVSYSETEKTYFANKIAQKYLAASRFMSISDMDNGRFLDVGAGEGWALNFFAQIGWSCLGLDYSGFGCEKQNPNVSERLITGDIYNNLALLINRQERYNLILLDNVLEHVLDPFSLLVNLQKLVSPGGVLIVEVPNDFSPLQMHLLQCGHIDEQFWIAAPDHISYFCPEGLTALASDAGWQVRSLMTDYPIDLNLVNPITNYVKRKDVGKSCHNARVEIENFLHLISPEGAVDLYQAFAKLGIGRELTAILTKA